MESTKNFLRRSFQTQDHNDLESSRSSSIEEALLQSGGRRVVFGEENLIPQPISGDISSFNYTIDIVNDLGYPLTQIVEPSDTVHSLALPLIRSTRFRS